MSALNFSVCQNTVHPSMSIVCRGGPMKVLTVATVDTDEMFQVSFPLSVLILVIT
jgi:hypothetical protein